MEQLTATIPHVTDNHEAQVAIYNQERETFDSEASMTNWLVEHDIDTELADRNKGLSKLYHKIEKGEAGLVYDETSKTVYRLARAAKISVEATILGEKYPLIELCQIFLNNKIDERQLQIEDPTEALKVIESLDIRSAQVRDSLELWETLVSEEDPKIGARRGIEEELNMSKDDAALAELQMISSQIGYEAPIDWPGIHSILEVHEAKATLPEKISKAAYAELEGDDQVTIFVATPGAPVIRQLLKKILKNIHYVAPIK